MSSSATAAERAALDEEASLPDPLKQFETWLNQAIEAKVPEPNAMTLATVGADGRWLGLAAIP